MNYIKNDGTLNVPGFVWDNTCHDIWENVQNNLRMNIRVNGDFIRLIKGHIDFKVDLKKIESTWEKL